MRKPKIYNCLYCLNIFKPSTRSKYCSIKCKLLGRVEKDDNGCWIWKLTKKDNIYGKVRWQKKWYSSHRASYEVFIGPIPDKLLVCHKCDMPSCINPDHLFVGTRKDNVQDAINKKRLILGVHIFAPKFNETQIKEMRMLKQEGFKYSRLSNIFNCSIPYLCSIVKNKKRI